MLREFVGGPWDGEWIFTHEDLHHFSIPLYDHQTVMQAGEDIPDSCIMRTGDYTLECWSTSSLLGGVTYSWCYKWMGER